MLTAIRRSNALIKSAAGDSQAFEESLASIGRSTMSSRAPALFKHEIGFQVLDSDDDNTRAVGVFGFRIGKRILYTPLFYRDGIIKGTEQIRDPKRNMVVPLTDNWVNKLLAEQGDEKPKLVSRSQMRRTAQPSLWQLKYPPTKYAADKLANREWVDEIKLDLAKVIGVRPSFPQELDLLKYASQDPRVFAILGRTMIRYPWFGDAVVKFHGGEKIAAAIAEVEQRHKNNVKAARSFDNRLSTIPRITKQSGVVVIRVRSFSMGSKPLHEAFDLPKEDLKELREGNNVYKDSRPAGKTTEVTTWLNDNAIANNPVGSNLYKVLEASFKESECAVFCAPIGWSNRPNECLVIRLSDKAHTYVSRSDVHVTGEAEPGRMAEWADTLPKAQKKLPEDKTLVGIHVLGRQSVSATVPFRMIDSESGDAYPSCGCGMWGGREPFWEHTQPGQVPPALNSPHEIPDRSNKRVRLWDHPAKLVRSGTCIYLPKDSHLLEIADEGISLATGTDPTKFLFREKKAFDAKNAFVQVRTGDNGFGIENPRTGKQCWFAYAPDAEEHLVVDHHFKVADARRLITDAKKSGNATCTVKYATEPYDGDPFLSHNFPNAPDVSPEFVNNPAGYADDVLPTETTSSLHIAIPDLLMQPGQQERYKPYPMTYGIYGHVPGIGNSPDGARKSGFSGGGSGSSGEMNDGKEPNTDGPDSSDLSTVYNAAQSGRKELFDTAALASLVKNTRLSRLLDEITPRISRTLTDLGNALAHMAWNVDEWTEQFGESEIGPLEDQFRDMFDGLGELYLKLQEKAVVDPRDHGLLPDSYTGDGGDVKK